MAINEHKRFTGYPAIFGATTIPDVVSVSPSAGVQKMVLTPDGAAQPAFAAVVAQDLRVSLVAVNIGAILTAFPLRSITRIDAASKIQYQARESGGVFATGSSHVVLSATLGDIYIESIRAQQDETSAAGLTLVFQPLFDGTNAPLVSLSGQALSGTPRILAAYKLGPTVFEGTVLKGVQSAQYNTRIQYSPKRGDGGIYAEQGSGITIADTLEVGFDNLELMTTVGFGTMPISAGITQYFRRVGSAPTDAHHIAITFHAGLYEISDASQSGTDDATGRLMVTGARDNAVAASVTIGTTLP